MFSLFYFHEKAAWFSYVFLVLNSLQVCASMYCSYLNHCLQGLFILLFEIVFNSKARNSVMKSISSKLPLTYAVSKTSSNVTVRTKSISSLRSPNAMLPNVSRSPEMHYNIKVNNFDANRGNVLRKKSSGSSTQSDNNEGSTSTSNEVAFSQRM